MPAIPLCIIEPLWDQVAALLPDHPNTHSLGCHRPRIPDWLVFDKLVQILVFGCAYHRIADTTVSATMLRRRRDEWISAGVMDTLLALVLTAYDRMIGLELGDIAINGCITTAPCGGEVAGRSPVDRGKQELKRSLAVDAAGITLGTVAAPANYHDVRLLEPTLDALAVTDAPMTVHLDRGYDSGRARQCLAERGLGAEIAAKGQPAPHGGGPALGRGVHHRLDQPAQETDLVYRAPGGRRRVLVRLLGRDHRRRPAHPRGVETLSGEWPPRPSTVRRTQLAQALTLRERPDACVRYWARQSLPQCVASTKKSPTSPIYSCHARASFRSIVRAAIAGRAQS